MLVPVRGPMAAGFLHNADGSLVERLGFRVVAAIYLNTGQVVQHVGYVRMLRPDGLLQSRERLNPQCLGLVKAARGAAPEGATMQAAGALDFVGTHSTRMTPVTYVFTQASC